MDPTKDDVVENDDPIVRKAAIEALGRYYGSVVAINLPPGASLRSSIRNWPFPQAIFLARPSSR